MDINDSKINTIKLNNEYNADKADVVQENAKYLTLPIQNLFRKLAI